MEHKIEWPEERIGYITFFEEGAEFLKAEVLITGEEEAEFRLQDVVFLEKSAETVDMCEKNIQKMINCVCECFRLLWEEGFAETVLEEASGTKIAEILDSTSVVQKVYRECMLKCCFEPKNSIGCGPQLIKGPEDEDGIIYRNKEKTFSCKIIPFAPDEDGETVVYLHGVEVDKKERNKGIGTACLAELFRMLSEKNPVTIHLQVGSYNKPAWHIYEKFGFQVFEENGYYVMEE